MSDMATAPSKLPITNNARLASIVLRMPNFSTSGALKSRQTVLAARKPEDSHCACSSPMPNASMTCTMTTLTIVLLSTVTKAALVTASIASQR